METLNGTIYEGQGFLPDVPAPFDEAAYQALQQGTDTRLEAALRVIRDK
jgi:C-terminal processing protease CtpA/Prc